MDTGERAVYSAFMLTRPDFFNSIDSEEKAYFLGFLSADGYVGWSPERYAYVVEIGLQDRDRDIIDKFQAAVGSSHKIVDKIVNGKPYPRLSIKNKQLAGSLKSLGLCPKTGCVPPGIPDHLLHHFFRGWFDGDGSVVQDKRGRYSVSVCGARPIVESFAAFCLPIVHRHYAIFDHSTICYYRLGGRQGLNVLERLHQDASVWLDRKRTTFEEMRSFFAARPLTSEFVGVSFNRAKGRYDAKVYFDGVQRHLGRFVKPEDAARAYDAFVVANRLSRELNFPEEHNGPIADRSRRGGPQRPPAPQRRQARPG